MNFIRRNLITIALVGSLALAATSGFFAASALGLITAGSPPTTTTTINAAVGETGPAGPAGATGPAGPAGDPGAESCPTGSSFEGVLINHPGGHVTIWTCVANP